MQIGAAELAGDIGRYNGSYVLAFAGYNAGRGRVKEWIERYGDPRDPKVDPIDWVERIPFPETRNYVQRIIESIQVYRARFVAPRCFRKFSTGFRRDRGICQPEQARPRG